MPYDPNNVFARILRGEMHAHRVYEDERTLAFMDVMPQSDGHTLVVPKSESENPFDLRPDMLLAVMRTAQKVARAVQASFGPSGIMLAQLNGAGAGQTVFHTHVHIIPRYDGIDMKFHARGLADPALLEKQARMIRGELDSGDLTD